MSLIPLLLPGTTFCYSTRLQGKLGGLTSLHYIPRKGWIRVWLFPHLCKNRLQTCLYTALTEFFEFCPITVHFTPPQCQNTLELPVCSIWKHRRHLIFPYRDLRKKCVHVVISLSVRPSASTTDGAFVWTEHGYFTLISYAACRPVPLASTAWGAGRKSRTPRWGWGKLPDFPRALVSTHFFRWERNQAQHVTVSRCSLPLLSPEPSNQADSLPPIQRKSHKQIN